MGPVKGQGITQLNCCRLYYILLHLCPYWLTYILKKGRRPYNFNSFQGISHFMSNKTVVFCQRKNAIFHIQLNEYETDPYFPKHDLRCAIASCELRCAVPSCGVRVRTHFFQTCDVRACGAFLGLRCAITTHVFFRDSARYKDKNVLFLV